MVLISGLYEDVDISMLHLPVEFSKQYIYLNMVMVMNSIKMGVV